MTNMPHPTHLSPDDADRATRQRIRLELGATLFVEAGAGTGKTKALVDRVVALVLSGVAVEKVAAITFTEKAAAELQSRVREALTDPARLAESHPEAFGDLEGEARHQAEERCTTAAHSLDGATFATIHAFCLEVLKAFAARAGVDPGFAVQDTMLADRRTGDRWRAHLRDLAGDAKARDAIDSVLRLGLTTRELRALADELASRPDLAVLLQDEPLSAEAPPDIGFSDHLQAIAYALTLNTGEHDELWDRLASLRDILHRLEAAPGRPQQEYILTAAVLKLDTWGVGAQGRWGDATGIAAARNTGREVTAALSEFRDAIRSVALARLLPYIVCFVREDAAARGREGTLVFDDLILLVRQLLAGPDGHDVRRSLRKRWQALLIDEFQDTDLLQYEIASLLAADPDTGVPDSGRLFLVGDPKQSIYRFRRADMAVYSKAKDDALAAGAASLQLARNYRSDPAILDWVNAVFARLIGDGANPSLQPAYIPITSPPRTEPLEGAAVAWFGEGWQAPVREIRAQEADDVAAHCLAVAGRWDVTEQDRELYKTVPVREARLSDIAILIPTRALLTPLQRALERANVPYRIEGGSLVYQTQDVRDLINCLGAIADPVDEIATVAALRSPAFGCSDVDLARHVAIGGRFDYISGSRWDDGSYVPRHPGPVGDGLAVLRRWHEQRDRYSLAALVEAFAGERCLTEAAVLDGSGRDAYRRVRFVVEQARAFEAGGPASLGAFLEWVEKRADSSERDHEGAALEDDQDAVRVMTIHAAKGLEFPVVILAGLNAGSSNRMPVFARAGDGAVAVNAGTNGRKFTLGDGATLKAIEDEHEKAEGARLLYVAATRARDHLLVSLHHGLTLKGKPRACPATRLIDHGAREHAPEAVLPPAVAAIAAGPFDAIEPEMPAYPSAPAGFTAAREALARGAKRHPVTSATAIARGRKAVESPAADHNSEPAERDHDGEPAERDDDSETVERDDDTEPWARGRGGTRLGRAVHAVLQSVPLAATDDEIAAFARAQAVAEAIPDLEGNIAALTRRALQSEVAQRARAGRRALREVPFAASLGGVLLEGFIDLMIETDDGIEIVDWKTDHVSGADIDRRLASYRLQAGLYILGMRAAVGPDGPPVTRVTYVFASPGVERSPGGPDELAAEAAEALGDLGRDGRVDDPVGAPARILG